MMATQSVQLGDRGARGQNAHVRRVCTRTHTKHSPVPLETKLRLHGGGRSRRINERQNETFKERKVAEWCFCLLLSTWPLTGWGCAFAFFCFNLWKVTLRGGRLKNNINVLSSNLTAEQSRRRRGGRWGRPEHNTSSRASGVKKERSAQVFMAGRLELKLTSLTKGNSLPSKLFLRWFWCVSHGVGWSHLFGKDHVNIPQWQKVEGEDAHLSLHPYSVTPSVCPGVTLSSHWLLTLL